MNHLLNLSSCSSLSRAANITVEEARAALLEYVADNCCYGKGAAEQMQMLNISPSNAFHVSHRELFFKSLELFILFSFVRTAVS